MHIYEKFEAATTKTMAWSIYKWANKLTYNANHYNYNDHDNCNDSR